MIKALTEAHCCCVNRSWKGKDIKTANGHTLTVACTNRGGKQSESGQIFKTNSAEFTDELGVQCERQESRISVNDIPQQIAIGKGDQRRYSQKTQEKSSSDMHLIVLVVLNSSGLCVIYEILKTCNLRFLFSH